MHDRKAVSHSRLKSCGLFIESGAVRKGWCSNDLVKGKQKTSTNEVQTWRNDVAKQKGPVKWQPYFARVLAARPNRFGHFLIKGGENAQIIEKSGRSNSRKAEDVCLGYPYRIFSLWWEVGNRAGTEVRKPPNFNFRVEMREKIHCFAVCGQRGWSMPKRDWVGHSCGRQLR